MDQAKTRYYLELADNALILSHQLATYSSRGPFLEEDLACTNVALDLIGLAESIYTELAKHTPEKSGDDLAYRREEHEYRNAILVEQPNRDFAYLMVRQFFMDTYHYYLFTELSCSNDVFLSAIANKSLKEVTYHLKRSSEWMIRFGNGTEESKQRVQTAWNELWKYTDELFEISKETRTLVETGIVADPSKIREFWNQKVNEIGYLAHLRNPKDGHQISGGKRGVHSEEMGKILSELQFLTNKYPDAKW